MKIRSSIAKLFVLGSCLFVLAGSPAQAQEQSLPARDPAKLQLSSRSAVLVDLNSGKLLYARNPTRVMPIASVTKLMVAVVVLESRQPLDEVLTVTIRDNREMRGVYSRVRLGSQLSRRELLHIALMSSENRATSTLAHHYPGGYRAFIAAMNAKARALGMKSTRYVEPTGLSPLNVSTANDLVVLLKETRKFPLMTQLSTTESKTVTFVKPRYSLGFRNTNGLVRKPNWSIQLTKTGFTNDAGHCLVMLTRMNQRPVAMVLLDAYGKYTHMADATRMRRWLETGTSGKVPAGALAHSR
ncbi:MULTISPECIES: D-alanyl-D-alanine endopeptidase [Pseudomonas]|uniref:D-alanyl-D-alanine endopeptidase n=1 Tax=Pseudomonadaceae TaxID=135621 RepID=UPI000426E875|nr:MULTISPECIES: D-alanyl-D-alanine endopeptidase [Pseudomonas]MDE3736991.1 D-alanyl-D-alanine endopeptidase [Pseudomonas resinovorans]